ncbi:MAG: M6 family metalloprotease domain-containing protein [Prevotella sp.]|nr:M6 family metalloprotease domain-containing protein [Prevotella sp.]
MKKLFATIVLLLAVTAVMAVPAKRGLWKTITLSDGTEMKATLQGDEFGHYWKGIDGKKYVKSGDTYVVMGEEVVKNAAARRAKAQQQRTKKMKARKGTSSYKGQKKGLIILVNFKDTKFQTADAATNTLYNNIANTPGFKDDNGFNGSVADYFKSQSRGDFELSFDVVGPVTVSQNASYYGENDKVYKQDKYPAEMVIEAVNRAKSSVSNWEQYDWDGDKKVDQVMIIYAGEGEASGGDASTIWPHEYNLAAANYYGDGSGPVSVGTDLVVDTYAVANEGMVESGLIMDSFVYMGIGTICHEFSHCLGLMDMYDTTYGGNFGMGDWDLMDHGSYNNGGFTPANYSSFEKEQIGWITPTELTDATNVSAMQAWNDVDECYKITNPANANEYYLLENRQQKGWDEFVPAAGLVILHVDYNKEIWDWNIANTNNDDTTDGAPLNDHQRCTIFHADGVEKSAEYNAKLDELVEQYNEADEAGDDDAADAIYEEYEAVLTELANDAAHDTYPQGDNNELSNTSKPRAFTYNANSDGRKLMNIKISSITQNSNGTIAFNFAPDNSGTEEGDNTEYGATSGPTGDYLFYESFNDCEGTGGNDGAWNGTIANSAFNPDNDGWTACSDSKGEKSYGAYKCAKFGTGSIDGYATTPTFTVNGTGKLTFKAGAWDAKNDGTTLNLSVSGGTISPTSVTMSKGAFKDFEATITATGNVKVTFATSKLRFFLDEVLVIDPTASGIQDIQTITRPADGKIYSIDGRYVGTDFGALKRGIYIMNGKKVVK